MRRNERPLLRYSEMARFDTLEDRFSYLKLRGVVGDETFGPERHFNQSFYRSREWKRVRDIVIVRDQGCDLGVPGWDIHAGLFIHHMNPMTLEQILNGDPDILNPDYLITVTMQTHNAIHFGSENLLPRNLVERKPGDTKLW